MLDIQIEDVPEATLVILEARAKAAHQSLEEYVRLRLIQEAAQPTLEEVVLGRAGASVWPS